MKKHKSAPKSSKTYLAPEDALQFLEDMRTLPSQINEPTVPISLRIPGNVLRAIKLKAKANGQKYQSLIIRYLRQGLLEKNSD